MISLFGGKLGQGAPTVRILRLLGVYFFGVGLVYGGYFLQSLITEAAKMQTYDTGLSGLVQVLKGVNTDIFLPQILIVGCVISCLVSFGDSNLSRVVTAFRASFVMYTTFDVIAGIGARFELEDYVATVLFNFVGSIFYAALFAFIINRFIPSDEPIPELQPV